MSFYEVDVKCFIEKYYILISLRCYYDSGGWERRSLEEEELLNDSFYRFFHNKYGNTHKNIELTFDKLILICSFLSSP